MNHSYTELVQLGCDYLQHIDSKHIDSLLIACFVLGCSKSNIYTSDKIVSDNQLMEFTRLCKLRATHYPIAYILNRKNFWDHDFYVTPDVLIPRVETEELVEIVLNTNQAARLSHPILELGVGSGALIISLALEKPQWNCLGVDFSYTSLQICVTNAQKLHCNNLDIFCADWLSAIADNSLSIIIANPPYIAHAEVQDLMPDLQYEPRQALFSGDNGMQDLLNIIESARSKLVLGGKIYLEHGSKQAKLVCKALQKKGFRNIQVIQDLAGHDRFTWAIL